ncbi:MAG: hypothetical protein V4549_07410 [Bacteroidota bacterium]
MTEGIEKREERLLPDTKSIRKSIMEYEEQIKSQEGAFIGDSPICPLKHTFSEGIYVREIRIPAGTYIVGKLHKHAHPNFLLSGVVDVVTEQGTTTLEGPMSMISPAGTKRALYVKQDVVWVTIHSNPTNTQDLKELESIVIADSYEEYEKFIESKNENKFISFIKKLLNWK